VIDRSSPWLIARYLHGDLALTWGGSGGFVPCSSPVLSYEEDRDHQLEGFG